jgi:ABC-2 type transport system permease protein
MFNLILKDILLQKKMIALILLYGIIFVFAFQNSEIAGFVAVVMAVTYALINTVASIEDKNKADIILNSLPIQRGKLILAKYISILVYMFMGVLSYIVATNLIKVFGFPIKVFPITIEAVMGAVIGVILMNSIYLPVFFKFGYTKSRIVSFILFFGMFFGIPAGIGYIKSNQNMSWIKDALEFLINRSDMQIAMLTISLMFLILLCSYMVSLRIYKNREF